MNLEQGKAKALSDVGTYGFHILKILGDEREPQFSYSIGIEATSHQPDLFVIGLKHDLGHWIVCEYNRRIRAGETFIPNQLYEGFLEGFPIMFSPVLKQNYNEYFGWGLWFYRGAEFRVFQVIYPDTSGRWPWDHSASEHYRELMPLLCERPLLPEGDKPYS